MLYVGLLEQNQTPEGDYYSFYSQQNTIKKVFVIIPVYSSVTVGLGLCSRYFHI